GDDDANDDGDDLSENDADDEDEEESSDSKEEEEEHLASTVPAPALADEKLIGRLRRERRYFRTVATTYAQEAMIDEGVNAALASRDATRNGDDSHTSGTCARRPVQAARECSYSEFLKCKPLDFK
nr:hypothetical protein [Tanacetum cinerariifolium]